MLYVLGGCTIPDWVVLGEVYSCFSQSTIRLAGALNWEERPLHSVYHPCPPPGQRTPCEFHSVFSLSCATCTGVSSWGYVAGSRYSSIDGTHKGRVHADKKSVFVLVRPCIGRRIFIGLPVSVPSTRDTQTNQHTRAYACGVVYLERFFLRLASAPSLRAQSLLRPIRSFSLLDSLRSTSRPP